MKSFQEFREQSNPLVSQELIRFVKMVRKDCKPYLREIDKAGEFLIRNPFFRGMNEPPGIYKRTVRKDRNPRDSNKWLHEYMDFYFLDRFGHRYRSNAAFAVTSMVKSESFGTGFMFFPIGKYDYVWSPKIKDMTVSLRVKQLDRIILRHSKLNVTQMTEEDVLKLLKKDDDLRRRVWKDFDKEFGYMKSRLIYSMDFTGHELMFKVDKYYAITPEYLNFMIDFDAINNDNFDSNKLFPEIQGVSMVQKKQLATLLMEIIVGRYDKILGLK